MALYGTVWHDGIINYSMKSMGSGIAWHCMAVFDGAGNRSRIILYLLVLYGGVLKVIP